MLRPRAMTRPARTITAPKGKSAWRASLSAIRMNRSSSTVDRSAAAAGSSVGTIAVQISPATTKRRLGYALRQRHASDMQHLPDSRAESLDLIPAAHNHFPITLLINRLSKFVQIDLRVMQGEVEGAPSLDKLNRTHAHNAPG